MDANASEGPNLFIKFVLVIVGMFLAFAGWYQLLF